MDKSRTQAAAPSGKSTPEISRRNAKATRVRIFEAARVRLSQTSYEAVGVRDIAIDAGVDPALVVRYFGSKENLFKEIARTAFGSVDVLQGDAITVAGCILQRLLQSKVGENWRAGYDPFRLLLCSISSEVAGPIISEAFHRSFVDKLARALEGPFKEARAALIASYVLGIALLRVTEPQATFEGDGGAFIRKQLSKALDDCFVPIPGDE